MFGLDFMIDIDLKAWLIEINTNPDITTTSPVLTKIIPNMVDNALKYESGIVLINIKRLTLDPMFPPYQWPYSKKQSLPEDLLGHNKFELVFNEAEEGAALKNILQQSDNGAQSKNSLSYDF